MRLNKLVILVFQFLESIRRKDGNYRFAKTVPGCASNLYQMHISILISKQVVLETMQVGLMDYLKNYKIVQ